MCNYEYWALTSADLPAACQLNVKRLLNVIFKSFTQAGGGGGLLVLFSLCSGYFCTTVKLLSHLNCIICYAIRDIYYRGLVYEYCVFGSAFMKLLKINECIALSRIFLHNGTSNCNETILHMRTFPTAYSNC